MKAVRDWKTHTADTYFSKWIRARDKHCRYPNCYATTTDNSHFFERKHSGTRFDPENCVALCRAHHTEWEVRKKHEYLDFMIAWLGMEKYMALQRRAWTFKKRSEAVTECMALLGHGSDVGTTALADPEIVYN